MATKGAKKPSGNGAVGMIDPQILYRLSALAREAGWGARSIRNARRKGLVVHQYGRNSYVLGRDAIALICRQPAEEREP